jgi:hypothetical protein
MAKAKSRRNDQDSRQAAPQAAGDTTVASPDRERVAARAYEIYQARGGSDGLAMDDWLQAERECAQNSGRADE